ncbi:TetR/AcrR family transcriptional regulator [bacterium]|nr:TetR/AcrR family transcriptional regulator [bacterium]
MKTDKTPSTHLESKEKIIEVAKDLFARYSFKKTTMDDIAKALEKAKSSIYYYFKSKEEIFLAVGSSEIEKWKNELIEVIKKESSANKKLVAYIKLRMSVIQSLSNFYHFLAEEYIENHTLAEKARAKLDREEFETIKGILEIGVKQGEFRVDSIELTAYNLLNILKGLEYFWLQEKNQVKLNEALSNMLDTLFYGLLKR